MGAILPCSSGILWFCSLFFLFRSFSNLQITRTGIKSRTCSDFCQIVLKLFRCFLHGMKMCMWFGYNPLIIFFSLFLFCELGLFSAQNAIVYRQWVPYGRNFSYSFPLIILKHCRCFQHGMKMCMWFGYNTLIIFSYFFCFVNLVSFFFT